MSNSVAPRLVETLRRDAADRTGTDATAWVVVSDRAMQWTDTSLGVREPGMMYGKIMIPGSRVVLRDGVDGTRELVYHTGFGGGFKFAHEQRRVADRELD